MDSKKVGSFISELRKQKGYTQTTLAEILNVSNRTVSKWENGDGYPDITILPEIAKTLGVTVDELLNGERTVLTELKEQNKNVDIVEKENKDSEKYSLYKFFNDPKLWFIISFFFGIFGALLGTITEMYCIWAFKILFYTHWEIIFVAVSLLAIVASGLAFMIGVFTATPELEKSSFLDYCKNNIQKILIYCAVWIVFPVSFFTRIFYLSRWGNFAMIFVIAVATIYVVLNVKIYKKYKSK